MCVATRGLATRRPLTKTITKFQGCILTKIIKSPLPGPLRDLDRVLGRTAKSEVVQATFENLFLLWEGGVCDGGANVLRIEKYPAKLVKSVALYAKFKVEQQISRSHLRPSDR